MRLVVSFVKLAIPICSKDKARKVFSRSLLWCKANRCGFCISVLVLLSDTRG